MKSKNCISLFGMLFAVVLALSNSGCGGASSSPPPSPPSVAPADITGQWSIIATDTANNTTAVFANISSQGGGDFFATGENTATCDLNTVQCQVTNTPNVTIQISQSNRVSASVSNVIDVSTGATETISADGTVDSTGTQMSGSWISTSKKAGTWQGRKDTFPGGGLYTGSMNSTASPAPIPVGVSLSFAQDASYNLTASATFTNSPCFTSLSFSGRTVGGAFYMTDSTSSIVLYGIGKSWELTVGARIGYKVLSGCNSGDQGQGTIAKPIKF